MLFQKWDVFLVELLLQRLGRCRNHHSSSATNRRLQVRQRFPRSSARFHNHMMARLKRFMNHFRHFQLRRAMLVSADHRPFQQTAWPEHFRHVDRRGTRRTRFNTIFASRLYPRCGLGFFFVKRNPTPLETSRRTARSGSLRNPLRRFGHPLCQSSRLPGIPLHRTENDSIPYKATLRAGPTRRFNMGGVPLPIRSGLALEHPAALWNSSGAGTALNSTWRSRSASQFGSSAKHIPRSSGVSQCSAKLRQPLFWFSRPWCLHRAAVYLTEAASQIVGVAMPLFPSF